jgi:hypothetical protein
LNAVRGPIVLIVLGSLLAIHKFDGPSFGTTWPVLIIVIGLLKLFEMMAARSPQPGGPAGGNLS